MCIVFRVLGSFLILDCHQSIGYPSGCMDDHESHGVTPSERYPCMAAAHRVHLGNGRTVLGFGVWIQQREFVFSDFSDEASVFFLNERTWWFFWVGMGWSGLPIVELNPTTQWKINFWFQVHWLLMPSSMATEVNINPPSWTVPCVSFEQHFSSLNMSMFPM